MKELKIFFKRSFLAAALLLLCIAGMKSVFAACGPVPICLPSFIDPNVIPKYADPLIIPPAMPAKNTLTITSATASGGFCDVDYYEIAMRQFVQQILPAPYRKTTVWSYGAEGIPGTFNYPAFTIEAKVNRPVRVKWINGLVDLNGNYLPHLLPIDQTLHWANPPGPRDSHGMDANAYTGPVPIVTHVHGSHVQPESDGYPEAWYLPAAKDIPPYIKYTTGTFYNKNKAIFEAKYGQTWEPGTAVFQYENDQDATTLWYHDHTLGMTRNNVYAGPAGFFLLRGGNKDLPAGVLPGPAPQLGDPPGKKYYEIPIAIQDRIFNKDGSLFFPADRAFFEGLLPNQLQIPFHPDVNPLNGLVSDVAPIWNPEFFGNAMVVNGRTWPYLNVEPRRYRFRFLDGCNARTLILKFDRPGLNFWQIGAEEGFLPAPVQLSQLQITLAERADVIVDFTGIPVGTKIKLLNIGPDFPFAGGTPGVDFPPADPNTTGQVMEFRIVPLASTDTSTPPANLTLPPFTPLGTPTLTRQLSLNEMDSNTVNVIVDANGNIVVNNGPNSFPFGPTMALLGIMDSNGNPVPKLWADPITEKPQLNATEYWEISNFTADGHPIHLHMVAFQVVDRRPLGTLPGAPGTIAPYPWETGFKDTVLALPGQITRLKAKFDIAGLYVWHCHIIDHEDNEMMRPYEVNAPPQSYPPVIIDNGTTGTSYTGNWMASGAPNPYGANSLWSYSGATYTWSFRPTVTAAYKISMWWTSLPSRSSAVPVRISRTGATLANLTVNQQQNGGMWNALGQYQLTAGTTYRVTITAPPGSPPSTCADAVKFERQ